MLPSNAEIWQARGKGERINESNLNRIGNAADERQRSGLNVILEARRNTTMNDDIIAYDKAKWHHEGDYPTDLPKKNAFTHTGMFLAWLADRGLLSPAFAEDFHEDLQQLNERKITPGRIFQIVDGVLTSDMLNDDGNAFSKTYYAPDGKYLRDYHGTLALTLPSVYHAADSWENYDKLKATIDRRYNEWRQSNGA